MKEVRYFAAGVLLVLCLGLLVKVAVPWFRDYDVVEAEIVFSRMRKHGDALGEILDMRAIADRSASGSLQYYGATYECLVENPWPFYVAMDGGDRRVWKLVEKTLRDGRAYHEEWYGSGAALEEGAEQKVPGILRSRGATNEVVMAIFAKVEAK